MIKSGPQFLQRQQALKFALKSGLLYVIILLYCQPADPRKLFDDFWSDWTDDFKRKGERRSLTFTDNQLKTMVRLDIQVRLQSHEQDLPNFGLDPMTDDEKATVEGLVNIEEAVIREEMDLLFLNWLPMLQPIFNSSRPSKRPSSTL